MDAQLNTGAHPARTHPEGQRDRPDEAPATTLAKIASARPARTGANSDPRQPRER